MGFYIIYYLFDDVLQYSMAEYQFRCLYRKASGILNEKSPFTIRIQKVFELNSTKNRIQKYNDYGSRLWHSS